jgi:hypothetical protein
MSTEFRDPTHDTVATYAVPRRFGMGTILAAITLFAVLAGSARGLGFSLLELTGAGVFVALVAGAQMIGPQMPRMASAAVGVAFALVALLSGLSDGDVEGALEIAHPIQFVWTVLFGGLIGYIVGALLAALYLVSDGMTRWLPAFTAVQASRGAER